jgi:PleD family two-component response regulator
VFSYCLVISSVTASHFFDDALAILTTFSDAVRYIGLKRKENSSVGTKMTKRFLVAAPPEVKDRLTGVFEDHAELVFVSNIGQATTQLDHSLFDLIVCTMQFDDSRLFEFLSLVRRRNDSKRTPFICVKVMPSKFIEEIEEDLKGAMLTMGATDYLLLSLYEETDGTKDKLKLDVKEYLIEEAPREKYSSSNKTVPGEGHPFYVW